MQGEQQHVLGGREAQQLRAQERAALKVEGIGGFVLRETQDFDVLFIGGQHVERDERQRELQFGGDALQGLAVVVDEGGAQASWRATRAFRAAWKASTSSEPLRRTATGM